MQNQITPNEWFFLIAFILTAGVLIVSAVLTVTARKMLHAALWLILTLFMVGVIFILLENPFFGIIQLLVYIGAIAILMVFAVMLTRRVMFDDTTQFSRGGVAAVISCLVLMGGLIFMIFKWPGFEMQIQGAVGTQVTISQLGQTLVSPDYYLLPFEVASVLLLAALVGAIYIGREKQSD
jgi:NADH-quinone oxidoreductase subunit J